MRVLALIAVCIMTSCGTKPDIGKARAMPGEIGKALNSGNSDQLKAVLANDAVLVRDNAPTLVGADAIASAYSKAFKQVGYRVSLTSEELNHVGELAVDRGKFEGTLSTPDGKTSVPVSGSYFHVLKSNGGDWVFWRGSWTFANPTATSCDGTGSRSCCCKDIGGNDCVAAPAGGCPSTHPIPILLP